MIIENSVVIADFIMGIFAPLKFITLLCGIATFVIGLVIFAVKTEENRKSPLRWWLIPLGLELLFAMWFFSTFSLQPA